MSHREPPKCDRLRDLEVRRKADGKKPRPTRGEVRAAKLVFDRVGHVFLRQPGVTAVDVGFQLEDRKDRFTGKVAVRVHVQNKQDERVLRRNGFTPISELELEELTGLGVSPPREERVPEPGKEEAFEWKQVCFEAPEDPEDPDSPVHEVPIDIIEARYLPANGAVQILKPKQSDQDFDDDEMGRFASEPVQPLVGGVSIGTIAGPAGTLGAVVWDSTDGAPCLLSNWHVLAGDPAATVGQACFQPALFDGGDTRTDAVGALKRWHFGRQGDAALAALTCDRPYAAGEVLGLHVPVVGTVKPELGMPVRKWGRTSGFSKGFIDGIHLTTNIRYSRVGTQRFDDQIHVAACSSGKEVSAQGDSGALWVTKYVPYDPSENGTGGETNGRESGEESRERHRKAIAVEAPLAQQSPPTGGDSNGEQAAYGDLKVYYAVALHFAGDAPGAKSGEFAVASPIHEIAERLKFSFRPVFFPSSRLVIRPAAPKPRRPEPALAARSFVQPGEDGGDDDGQPGPQPRPIVIPP